MVVDSVPLGTGQRKKINLRPVLLEQPINNPIHQQPNPVSPWHQIATWYLPAWYPHNVAMILCTPSSKREDTMRLGEMRDNAAIPAGTFSGFMRTLPLPTNHSIVSYALLLSEFRRHQPRQANCRITLSLYSHGLHTSYNLAATDTIGFQVCNLRT